MQEHVIFTYRFNLGHIRSLVKDLTDEQMVAQPHGVVNHPAWTLKHLASSANYVAKTLGLESTFPPDWEATPTVDGVPERRRRAVPVQGRAARRADRPARAGRHRAGERRPRRSSPRSLRTKACASTPPDR